MPDVPSRIRKKFRAGARAAALVLAGSLLGACAATEALAPSYPLTLKDRDLMAAATQEALEKNQLGQGANWFNPETGRRGTATPLRTFRSRADEPCRDYQMTVTHENRTEFAYYTACRNKNGQWVNLGRLGLAGNYFEPQPREYVYERYDYPPPFWYRRPYFYDPWGYPHFHPYSGFHGHFLYRQRWRRR